MGPVKEHDPKGFMKRRWTAKCWNVAHYQKNVARCHVQCATKWYVKWFMKKLTRSMIVMIIHDLFNVEEKDAILNGKVFII